jgi:hypothetical protein
MFRVHSCRFRNEDYKENCARALMRNKVSIFAQSFLAYNVCYEISLTDGLMIVLIDYTTGLKVV